MSNPIEPNYVKAHAAVTRAVKNGTLKRKPCAFCGRIDSQTHHEDYSQPLNVVWLCSSHHAWFLIKAFSPGHQKQFNALRSLVMAIFERQKRPLEVPTNALQGDLARPAENNVVRGGEEPQP